MSFFPDLLDSFGEAPALITESGSVVSYRELARRADSFGRELGPTRKLLLLEARNEVEAIVAYVAALRGRHPIIMVPQGSLEKDQGIATTFQPDLIYQYKEDKWQLSATDQPSSVSLHEDLALLLSTSGSTGSAKLVRLSRENVQANARSIAGYLKLDSSERPITCLPIHYSYGLSVLNSHLQVGAGIILTSRSVSEESFWELVATQKATSLAGVPYTYEVFERMGFRSRELPCLRYLTQAGGRLSAELVRSYAQWARAKSVEFFVMYGQTEATARIAYLPPHLAESHSDCIGVPIPDGNLHLENERGEIVTARNVEGELVYTGPNVMLGYATARAHLAAGREINALRTGDLALCTDEGLFRITGRTSRFSKLFGLRIGFDEIEKELRKNGFEAYVTGNDQLIAVFTSTAAAHGKILSLLAKRYSIPATCFQILEAATPPLLSTGKIDYRTILAQAQQARNAGQSLETAQDADTKARIFAAYRPIRGSANATDSDSFLSLGGDSLNFVEVSSSLERILGATPKGWEKLTIAELAGMRHQRKSAFVSVPTDVCIRALAILGVIVTHASDFHVGGGAFLLFVISGLNFARFQATHILAGKVARVLRTFSLNILLPYYAILLVYFSYRKSVDPASLLLVSNLFGRFGSFLEPFWFIESLFQVVLLTCLVFAIPSMRFLAGRNSWQAGLIFCVAAGCARLFLPDLSGLIVYAGRLPHNVFILFGLGWLLHFATTLSRRMIFSVLLVIVAAIFYHAAISHLVWLIGGMLAVTWVPHLSLPKAIGSILSTIGGCSYYIYLTHMLVVMAAIRFLPDYALPLSLVLSPPFGLFCRWASQFLLNLLQSRLSGGSSAAPNQSY